MTRFKDNAKDNNKDGLESKTMNATRATEQSQDSQRQYPDLDDRYGKIGISAVAAAVRHQGEQRNVDREPLHPLRPRLSGARPGRLTPGRLPCLIFITATIDAARPR